MTTNQAITDQGVIVACNGPAEGPRTELFGGPFKGDDKYLGGDLGRDGYIYTVPGSGKCVLRIDPNTLEVIEFGTPTKGPYVSSSLPANQFKWLRGALSPIDGCIYGIPSNANSVLKINPADGSVSFIGGPFEGCWKWHGGALGSDGCIYGIPANATSILKVNPATQEITTIGDGKFIGRNKWYGGLAAPDGCIYGMPYNANCVLKINPATQEVSMHGQDLLKEGGWKWHGGVIGPDGCIYAMPSHADCVLKVIPGETVGIKFIGNLSISDNTIHYKYKFGGGVVGADGNVYGIPSDADRAIRINIAEETVDEIGPRMVCKNKWQNGYSARDGCVYCIPCDADAILRINPFAENEEDHVTTIGGPLTEGSEKWEGGVVGPDGCMYCVPQQSKYVLRIVPGPAREN